MRFNSVHFLIFFPIVVLGYFVVPKKIKNLWLLIASYYFYMSWKPVYALLIFFSTLSTYLRGLAIDKSKSKAGAKAVLAVNIIINIAILFYFKYFNFFIEIITSLVPGLQLQQNNNLLAVVGISFYTFQSLGYSIDVYRKKVPAEKNFLTYALFVSFFPQLVAGPIERSENLLPQLKKTYKFDYNRVTDGLVLMAWGFFKKMVIADGCGKIVDIVFDNISSYGGLRFMIAAVLFAFQIYGDFSGYSDIAIGAANVIGIKLMKNFDHPYFAQSPVDFWRRWHISLSGWFMDYVYIPLGGNRKGLDRQILNILIVWTLTGIWHGAGWNFLFWGLWFALFLILEKLFLGELLKNAPVVFGRVYTLTVVLISWVFFALEKPGEILAYLQAMFGLNGVGLMNTQAMFLGNEYLVLLIIALVACLPVGSLLIHRLKSSKTGPAMALYRVGEKVIPAALLILSVAYIVDASYNPFLYFRF